MLEQLAEDIKVAMKSKEKDKLEALRYLKSMLMENKTSKSPIAEQEVVIKHYKKLQDSLALYPQESETYKKILGEMGFVSAYMPKQMTEEEVKDLIHSIVQKTGGGNFGAVMKELSPQIKGKFDGKRASDLVKETLGSSVP